ncbi:MAG: hypothetical protein Q8L39_09175 [Burkholderiales bacterium]|nr:hypothetical protein [Burkholderiales bacterium]
MQIITASEARSLSAHAQSWIDAHMMWFMNHVMGAIAHEAAAGGNSLTFDNIRVGSDVDIEAWKNEMEKLGYEIAFLTGEERSYDSFEVRW